MARKVRKPFASRLGMTFFQRWVKQKAHFFIFPAVSKLKIETVDFLKQENREAHRTDEYEIQQLIVRRGQAFDITVTFNRGYNPDNDVIVVQFVTGI